MVDRLLLEFIEDGEVATLFDYTLVHVDFSIALKGGGSSLSTAVAISNFFDSFDSIFCDVLIAHNLIAIECSSFSDDDVVQLIYEYAARHKIAAEAVALSRIRRDQRRLQQSSSFVVWHSVIQMRSNMQQDSVADATERVSRLIALAAKTPPIIRSPHRRYFRLRPGLEKLNAGEIILGIDFVGYTQRRRAPGNRWVGRGLCDELTLHAKSLPWNNAEELLASLFGLRVKQQLELEEVLARVCSDAVKCEGKVLRTGLDGGVGNDGPLVLLRANRAEQFLHRLRETLAAGIYEFVYAVGRDLTHRSLSNIESGLLASKREYGSKPKPSDLLQ